MANKRKKRPTPAKEDSELEAAYQKVTHQRQKPGKFAFRGSDDQKTRIAVIVAISVTVVLLLALGIYMIVTVSSMDSPQPYNRNLIVAGVDISNMTQQEAKSAILDAAEISFSRETTIIKIGQYTLELTPGVTEANLDIDALMEAIDASPAAAGEFDILPYLSVNKEAVIASLQKQWEPYATQQTPPTWKLEGEEPDLSKEKEDIQCQTLVITMGTSSKQLDFEALYEEILKNYNKNSFELEFAYTSDHPEAPDLEEIHRQLTTEPVDAVMNMETFQVTPHTFGYTFDLQKAQEALVHIDNSPVLEIPMILQDPESTEKQLSSLLFRDVLGTFTAKSNSSPGRDTNLKLSCEAINGLVLKPGEVFSYNDTLGERTPDKGWQQAPGYSGTNTVMTYGGGICQTSSTLYYCAMAADLEIVERHSHTFLPSYMPFGMDATVSWKGPDLKIRNNTQYPIRVEASSQGGSVTVSLIGTDMRDYYIKTEYEINWKEDYSTIYEELPTYNPEGYLDGDIIITPHTGYKITTYRCKYNKETDALISKDKEVTSVYSRRDQIICKIVDPPTEPPVTQAPTDAPVPSGSITEDGSEAGMNTEQGGSPQ